MITRSDASAEYIASIFRVTQLVSAPAWPVSAHRLKIRRHNTQHSVVPSPPLFPSSRTNTWLLPSVGNHVPDYTVAYYYF